MPKRDRKCCYKLYDVYDGDAELLGTFGSLEEVRSAADERDADTDGEWWPLLIESTTKTRVVEGWRCGNA